MKKILIIEDNSFVSNIYRTRLENEKYSVTVAQDGQSGYYAVSEIKPDVVLLDLSIPQMDALSVLGKVRAQKQFKKLPVFVMADSDSGSVVDDAMAAGGTHCFNKADETALDDVVAALSDLFKSYLNKPPVTKGFVPATPSQSRSPNARPPVVHNQAAPPSDRISPPETPDEVDPFPRFEYDAQTVYSARTAVAEAPVYAELARKPAPSPTQTTKATGRSVIVEPAELDSASIQNELQGHFLDSYGSTVHKIRGLFVSLINAKGAPDRVQNTEELWSQIRNLRSSAAQSGLAGLTRLCAPLEALAARAKSAEPDCASAGLQRLAGTIDLLVALGKHLGEIEPLNRIEPRVLVVDDDNVSRKALTLSLQKAKIVAIGAKDSSSALMEVEGSLFDLMFLDVEMPGINGFGLCARIRLMPSQKSTPIIFVSSLEDLKSRASSRISGGNHFITKPVNFDELNMTALTFIFKHRLRDALQKNGDKNWTEFR